MNITKRQPVSVGEITTEEFLVPMSLPQGQLEYRKNKRPFLQVQLLYTTNDTPLYQ